jgi:hypothetical protein
MSKRQEAKRQVAELKRDEDKVLKDLAKAVARYEKVNDRRDDVGFVSGESSEADRTEVDSLTKEAKTIRRNIRKRKRRLARVRKNLGNARRRLRSILLRPRIIDLKLDFKPMTLQGSVNKVIGHYTAGPQDDNTKDAIRLCKIYHQAHLNQGWSGEAYMLCFTVDGDILLLRPAKWVGAHTLGYNTGSYGIMMHGTTGDRPTKAQKRAIRWWGKNGHKNSMKSAKTNSRPDTLPWYGHNDFNATSCPGLFKDTYKSKGKN